MLTERSGQLREISRHFLIECLDVGTDPVHTDPGISWEMFGLDRQFLVGSSWKPLKFTGVQDGGTQITVHSPRPAQLMSR